jgi:hypothetical protein
MDFRPFVARIERTEIAADQYPRSSLETPRSGAALRMTTVWVVARFDSETAEDVLAPQIRKISSYEAA